MKNLLTIVLVLAVGAYVWLSQDTNPDAKAKSNGSGSVQTDPAHGVGSAAGKTAPAKKSLAKDAVRRAGKRVPTKSGVKQVLVTLRNGHKEDIGPTLARIEKGIKHSHRNDGSVFGNYEKLLPRKSRGYYKEYVHPTPRRRGPGARRIVIGKQGEIYYTHDHYKSFTKVVLR